MRVLCLDYGSARCGMAVSDWTGTLARPLEPVLRPDTEAGMSEIAALADELEAGLILVGLPVLPTGEEGAQARASRSFAGRLKQLTDRDVELYDERFTTQMAVQSMQSGALATEDSLAAAHLLQSYLEAVRLADEADDGADEGEDFAP